VGGCRQDLLDVIVVQFQRRGVYEVEDRAHCPGRDPVQVYLVLAWLDHGTVGEHGAKVIAAGRQNDAVSLQKRVFLLDRFIKCG